MSAGIIKEGGSSLAEQGRVLATLDDWRAITFVLIIVIVILSLERFFAARGMRAERVEMSKERQTMWAVSDKFGTASEKLGEASAKVGAELQVTANLNARVESALGRVESLLNARSR